MVVGTCSSTSMCLAAGVKSDGPSVAVTGMPVPGIGCGVDRITLVDGRALAADETR